MSMLRRSREVGVFRVFDELDLPGEERSADEIEAMLQKSLGEMSEAGAPEDLRSRMRVQTAAYLLDRYCASGNRSDLDAAIRCSQELRTAGADDENYPYYLDFLGQLLMARYPLTKRLDDLTEAIDAYRQAVAASSDGFAALQGFATNLGNALADLYARTEIPAHLEEAIGVYRAAVNAASPQATNLAGLLANLSEGLRARFTRSENPADLDDVIDVLRHATLAATPDDPLRFDLHNNLGVNLVDRFERARDVVDLDEAIANYDCTVPQLVDRPDDLSIHLAGRGNAWRRRHQHDGSRASIDRAIDDYRAAAAAALDLPALAIHLTSLANASMDRFHLTDHMHDLDEAISGYRRVVTLHPQRYERRAGLLTALANALSNRWELAEDVADLEAAVQTQEEAVAQTAPGSEDWPGHLSSLGNRYLDRYYHGADLADLDAAITHHSGAVQATPADSEELPAHLGNWANSLRARYDRCGDPDHLDRAVAANARAVMTVPETSENYPAHLINWAFTLMARYRRDAVLADLDTANEALRRANTAADAVAPTGRASVLLARYDNTRVGADLDEAIQLYEESIGQRIGRRENLRRLSGLANALSDRYERDNDLRDLDRAIDVQREVLARVPTQAPERAGYCTNLGGNLLLRHDVTDDAETRNTALAEAVDLCREAVRSTADGSPEASGYLVNLAEGLRRTGGGEGATEHYRKACNLGLRAAPRVVLVAANLWGAWATNRQAWLEAREAYRFGFETLRRLVGLQASRADKETFLRGTRRIAAGLANACAMTEDPQGAVLALEQGRAMLLVEMLQDRHPPAPASTSVATRSAEPSFAKIARTADACPLVYLAAADTRGLALVVHGSDVQHVPLDELSDGALRDRTAVHMFTYGLFRQDPNRYRGIWTDALSTITAWLWSAAVRPVLDALDGAGEAVFVAGGLLGLLPLHAAWTADATTPTGRRYALDQLTISYAPNAQALRAARELAGRVPVQQLLTVVEPLPVSAGRLPEARIEALGFAAGAGTSLTTTLLCGADATPQHFRRDAGTADVLHMVCHGSADLQEPLDSHLLLADDQQIRLRDLMVMPLQVRLAVLSACETGLPGIDVPDEVLALPTGLLQAGVAGVTASQWTVPDGPTAMLMTEFARLWAGGAMPPASALRGAQRWLRDTTNLQKQEHWRRTGLPAQVRDTFIRQVASGPLNRRSYEDMATWAAFTHVGA